MDASVYLIFVFLFKSFLCAPQPTAQRTPSGDYSVTHLDIRDAVLSLVRVLQDQMDKLERHEGRERQLGEQLTRSLSTLEKRSRGEEKNIENIASFVARIDDRVRTVQTSLDKQTEERRSEHDKSAQELASLKNSLGGQSSSGSVERKLDGLNDRVQSLHALTLTQGSNITTLLQKSEDTTIQELTEIKEQLTRTSELLSPKPSEWQGELIDSVDSQRKQLALLEEEIGKALRYLLNITKSAGGLHSAINQLNADTANGFQSLQLGGTTDSLAKLEQVVAKGQTGVQESINLTHSAVQDLITRVQAGHEKLAKEMRGLANVESVLLDTGDSVLDTKRRLEYGVQQILGELGMQLKENTKSLNESLQLRFNTLAYSVLVNQTNSLTNLTSRMEEEISQVWRQIGILYHQMSRSANLLDEIHSQTSKYVNNSLDTMSSMDGKVGQITNRMGEVDDNLNYLLGRMSLVVQEFNMIKNGLGEALVSLKEDLGVVNEEDNSTLSKS